MQFVFTDELKQELLDTIKAIGIRSKGIKEFAEKNGITTSRANSYFYKKLLTPELDKELPKGNSIPSKKTTTSIPRTPSESQPQEKPELGFKPTRPKIIPLDKAIQEIVDKKGGESLTIQDIEEAAKRANVHYHVAFSTLGSMVSRGKIKIGKMLEDEHLKMAETLAIESVVAWKYPEDVAKTVDLLVKKMKMNDREAMSLIGGVLVKPEYEACVTQVTEYDRENRYLKFRVKSLEGKLAKTQEPTEDPVKFKHILNLTTRIEELEHEVAILQDKLRASRKINLSALIQLQSRNQSLNRHLFPETKIEIAN